MARNKTPVSTDGSDRRDDAVDDPAADELAGGRRASPAGGVVEMRRGRRSRGRRSRRRRSRRSRSGRRRSSGTGGGAYADDGHTSDNTSQGRDDYDDGASADGDDEAADASGRRRRGRKSRRRRSRRTSSSSSSRGRRRRRMSGRGRRRRVAGDENNVVDRRDLAGTSFDAVEITDAASGRRRRRRRRGSRRRSRSSGRRTLRRQRRVLAEECGESAADELNDATPSNDLLVSTTRDAASRSRPSRRRTAGGQSHEC